MTTPPAKPLDYFERAVFKLASSEGGYAPVMTKPTGQEVDPWWRILPFGDIILYRTLNRLTAKGLLRIETRKGYSRKLKTYRTIGTTSI